MSSGPEDQAAPVPGPPVVFVGRRTEAARLARLLRAHPVITITGPPGIGKTALAGLVARRLATARAVRWLDAKHLDAREPGAELAGELAGADRDGLLLVVDDVHDLPRAAQRGLLESGRLLARGRLLALFRRRPSLDPLTALEVPDVPLGALSPVAARGLLRRLVRDAGLPPPSAIDEQRLLAQFGSTPLGARLACGLASLGTAWSELVCVRSRRLGPWLVAQLGGLCEGEASALAALAIARAALPANILRSASKCDAEAIERLVHAGLLEQDVDGRLTVHDALAPLFRQLLPQDAAPVHGALAGALRAARDGAPALQLARAEIDHALLAQDRSGLGSTYDALFGLLFRAGDFARLRVAQEALAALRGDHRFRLDRAQVAVLCGHLDEAAGALEELLDERLPARVRAEAHLLAGAAARARSQTADAATHYRAALAHYRRAKDRDGEARAINNLANAQAELGSLAEARAHYERTLRLSREIDNRFGVAAALANLGMLALRQNDPVPAGPFLEEALAIREAQQDRPGMASVMTAMARRAHLLGEPARALALCDEALQLRLSAGAPAGILECRVVRAHLLERAGRAREACREWIGALWLALALRHAPRIAEVLERMALARQRGSGLRPAELALVRRAGEISTATGLWAALLIGPDSAAAGDAWLARAADQLDGAPGCLAARALADRAGRPPAGRPWTERVTALSPAGRMRFLEMVRAVGLEGPATYLFVSRTGSRSISSEEAWCVDGTAHQLFVDGRSRRIFKEGRPIAQLARFERAWRLLWALVRRRGTPAPLPDIYAEVTGEPFIAGVHENNCYVMLRRLRVHLKDASTAVEVDAGRMYFDARLDFAAIGRLAGGDPGTRPRQRTSRDRRPPRDASAGPGATGE